MRYSKEEDLAADVIAFLQRSGWTDIYSEVLFNGAPIDIVAVRTRPGIKEVLICETKLAFNIHLLQQARRNSYAATYTTIATPHIRMNWDDAQLVKDILDWLNIGMLRVDGKFVLEDKSLPKGDANIQAILDVLRPEHKSFAKAGSNRGYFTAFKVVAEAVALHVRDNPGCALKELCELEAVKKYYPKPSQAKRNIQRNLESKIIKHCELRSEAGKLFVYPFHPALGPKI